MMKLFLLFWTIIVSNIEILFGEEYNCTWSYPSKNSTYDLCSLQLTESDQFYYYQVFDLGSTDSVRNFTYLFNVGATISDDADIEDICYNETLRNEDSDTLGYCTNIFNNSCVDDAIENITTRTAAYQLNGHHNKCWRLHDGVTPPTWSLINDDDPTDGVQLTYINGDWCNAGKNRELIIQFICDNDISNTFDREETIEEIETCTYVVKLYSIYGCPIECPYVDDQLCNNQGLCEFDFSNNKSKCFCYQGYYGNECVDLTDTDQITIYNDNDEQYVGGLIIVVILLFVMLAILFYLGLRFTKINKSTIKSDIVKKLVSKRIGKSNKHGNVVNEDSYDDDERTAV